MGTPSSKISLCSGVPLNNRYGHTLYFKSKADQIAYFNGKVVKSYSGYTYLRKTWKVKVNATMAEAWEWSYLFFANRAEGSESKTYYYFINQIEYINDNTVELSLELDVLQTYMFDWILRPCFVEREHSATDELGANTVDEGLDVGEYTIWDTYNIDFTTNITVIIASTIDLNKYYINGVEDRIAGSNYDNIFGGFQLTAVPLQTMPDWDNMAWDDLVKVLYKLEQDGKSDAVFNMWEYPGELIQWTDGEFDTAILKYVEGGKTFHVSIAERPYQFGNFTPKNQKTLQYPYCFLYATNKQGGAAIYQYDKFSTGIPQFRVMGNIAPDGFVRLTPALYKGAVLNFDESLSVGNFPTCSWNNDTYKLWLAQNQTQQNLGLALDGLKIVGGAAAIAGGVAATAGTFGGGAGLGVAGVSTGVGLISSGATGIASQLAQRADRDVQPPQARGNFSGSHNISNGIHGFEIQHKCIDEHHARMIDNYFTMYGYATRLVKLPNISSRPAFNYVKTIGSNVGGNICMEDLQVINSIFDKGITFWKNTDVGNYDLDNTP